MKEKGNKKERANHTEAASVKALIFELSTLLCTLCTFYTVYSRIYTLNPLSTRIYSIYEDYDFPSFRAIQTLSLLFTAHLVPQRLTGDSSAQLDTPASERSQS